MTPKEGVYDIRESLKLLSIDSDKTDRHIMFLMNVYRALVIRQQISNKPGEYRNQLTQTLYMRTELVDKTRFPQYATTGIDIVATVKVLPSTIGEQLYKDIEINPVNLLGPEIEVIHKSRAKEINFSPKGFVYAFREDDGKIYFLSPHLTSLNLAEVAVTVILEDPESILTVHDSIEELETYPITANLWINVKQMVMEHIAREMSVPIDLINNAKDEQEASTQK